MFCIQLEKDRLEKYTKAEEKVVDKLLHLSSSLKGKLKFD